MQWPRRYRRGHCFCRVRVPGRWGLRSGAMGPQFIFTMRDLRRFPPPDREVLSGINISMFPAAKIGVLGANGAGKSSLLRIMAGEDDGYTGEARLTPGFTVGHLPQEPVLDPSTEVLGNVMQGVAPVADLVTRYEEVCAAFAEPDADMDALLTEQATLQDKIDATGAWDLDRKVEVAMDALRVPAGDTEVSTLSGGERRRVALCRLLLSAPDLLLLDEPTNHLDAESVAWLERHLAEYRGTIVAVTHDRYFLDNVAGWILELDRARGIPYEGNYSSWLEQKQKRLQQEEKTEKVRQNPRGRQTKQKARLQNFEALVAQERNVKLDEVQIHIPTSTHLGNVVVEAENLRKGFGDNLLIEDLTFSLPPGGIVGVIGPNGAGKTTLFRMITGQEQPDAGTLRI